MKKKLDLQKLNISSFVTNLTPNKSNLLKGGSSDPPPGTLNSNCTVSDWDSIGPCPTDIPQLCFPTSHQQQK